MRRRLTRTGLRHCRDAGRCFLDYNINCVFGRNNSVPNAMPAELKQAYAVDLNGMRELILAEVKTRVAEVDRKSDEAATAL